MKKIKLVISVIYVLLSLTGCIQVPKIKTQHQHRIFQYDRPCPAQFQLSLGDTLQFSAPESLNTTYQWQLTQPLHHFNATTQVQSQWSTADSVLARRYFTFTATAVGDEMIDVVYAAPLSWRHGQPAVERWTCHVTIK